MKNKIFELAHKVFYERSNCALSSTDDLSDSYGADSRISDVDLKEHLSRADLKE